jgi:hypothetical protein
MKVTVREVGEFFKKHNETTDFRRFWPRLRLLMDTFGDVPMEELRRRQVWECFGGNTMREQPGSFCTEWVGWSYLRDSLEAVKRVFGYAVKPRKNWRTGVASAPLISRYDNPLDGVVVNLRRDTACWKAQAPTKELIFEMTANSEAAWRLAQQKKAATR